MQQGKIKKTIQKIIRFIKEQPEKTLFYLCIFGLLYAALLLVLPKEKPQYSILYLEPDYYGKSFSESAFARFGIENHESSDYNYETSFFLDEFDSNTLRQSILLGKKSFFAEKNNSIIQFVSFPLPKNIEQKNLRFRIVTSAFGTDYSVHFWLDTNKSN
jgi:hypothetical protein